MGFVDISSNLSLNRRNHPWLYNLHCLTYFMIQVERIVMVLVACTLELASFHDRSSVSCSFDLHKVTTLPGQSFTLSRLRCVRVCALLIVPVQSCASVLFHVICTRYAHCTVLVFVSDTCHSLRNIQWLVSLRDYKLTKHQFAHLVPARVARKINLK